MTTTVPTAASSNPKRAVFIVAALMVAAIAVALLVSLGSGDDDSLQGITAGEAAKIPAGSVRQVSFAEVSGAALPRFDPALGADPAIGQPAPAITASYYTNTEVTLDLAGGEPHVVLFVAHWCPHCQAEVKSLTEWFTANGVPTDVEVVAVSTSVDEGSPNYPPSSWFLREEWPIPVLRDSADGDLAAAYGLSSFPYMVVVGGDGNVITRISGGQTTSQWEATLDLARS